MFSAICIQPRNYTCKIFAWILLLILDHCCNIDIVTSLSSSVLMCSCPTLVKSAVLPKSTSLCSSITVITLWVLVQAGEEGESGIFHVKEKTRIRNAASHTSVFSIHFVSWFNFLLHCTLSWTFSELSPCEVNAPDFYKSFLFIGTRTAKLVDLAFCLFLNIGDDLVDFKKTIR